MPFHPSDHKMWPAKNDSYCLCLKFGHGAGATLCFVYNISAVCPGLSRSVVQTEARCKPGSPPIMTLCLSWTYILLIENKNEKVGQYADRSFTLSPLKLILWIIAHSNYLNLLVSSHVYVAASHCWRHRDACVYQLFCKCKYTDRTEELREQIQPEQVCSFKPDSSACWNTSPGHQSCTATSVWTGATLGDSSYS